MKKIVLLAFVLVLLSTAIVWGFMRPTVGHTYETNSSSAEGKFVFASSKTIWVPDNFTSIQEAVNNASDGDTIFVRADTYDEHVTVNKSVSLIGENRSTTIIDGSGKGTVVSVTADNVTINGFTMQNSGKNGYWSFLAGIYLQSSSNRIAGNAIMSNNYGIIATTPYAKGSDKNTIADNIIQNNNYGILAFGKGNIITGNTITGNNRHGIWFQGLWGNDSNTVTGNIVSNSQYGISLCSYIIIGGVTSSDLRHNILQGSSELPFPPLSNNTVSDNMVTSCEYGIDIYLCNGNTIITGNTITSNNVGLSILCDYMCSSNNTIYHNNFISNQLQVSVFNSVDNFWDNGVEGNYWSNYTGVDSNHDGIGDSPHVIDTNNTDNYPLMGMFNSYSGILGYYVNVISNSTIDDFTFFGSLVDFESKSTIRMYVSNSSATQSFGFCRVCIPKILMSPPYTVIINDGLTEVLYFNDTIHDDDTYRWIYFAYEHSTHRVEIIPEFPTWTSMLLILIVLTVAIAIHKRRTLRTAIH